MRKLLTIFILGILLCFFTHAQNQRYATQSLLSEGKWVKIRVDKTGIFKLTYADLKKMGFDDPSKVSIHGDGGWKLDEDFSRDYVDDLPSTPVWRGPDYLLFYGKGPIRWTYSDFEQQFVHEQNPYSTVGYYFVTDATPTLEVQKVASVDGAKIRVSSFDDYFLHEQELVSVAQTGRELYGEDFSSGQPRTLKTFSSIPGITDEEGVITMSFLSKVPSGTGVASLSINQSEVLTVSIPQNRENYVKALRRESSSRWVGPKNEKNTVVVSYNKSSHNNVRLDFVRLQCMRTLKPYGAYTFFRSLAAVNNVSRFLVSEANSHTVVLDVTDSKAVKQIETQLKGSDLEFSIPAGELREFVLVSTDKNFPTPEVIGEVPNQNLHGMAQTDMIIIAPEIFHSQAERLAEIHREKDALTVEVVDPQLIYNEFSSGNPDATAYRRFMKMFYDRSLAAGNPPKYLLLFGDGLYDNRGLTADAVGVAKENMLLTYQSRESLSEFSSRYGYSYVTDDYYALLQDVSADALADVSSVCLGVGRFPVRTSLEARRVVDKVIQYLKNEELGSWKNQITFVADDGSHADQYTTKHQEQADRLAQFIENEHPAFVANKVYFDAFKRSNDGSYPGAHDRIKDLLKQGQLLINYTGHGNTTALSDEHVWTQTDIMQSTYSKLPVWVTATCDFTRFDDPITSAGESVFLNEKSGGIALFTTTRVVESSANARLNEELYRQLFQKKADGTARTLGEAMMETKRNLTGINKLNFILIGDPALRLSYPEYKAQVTAINGEPITSDPYSFKALQRITVEGEVYDPKGNIASDFTGRLYAKVLDSQARLTTLGNNVIDGEAKRFTYMDYPNTIFVGQDSVSKGKFSFTFMVPKDISYSNLPGKLNMYAWDVEKGNEAQGSFMNYVVGGTSEEAVKDTIGPEIRQLYLNDTTFVEGGKVNTTPFFVARLWDKSGVNMTGSSIGHDIMLTIDDDPLMSYNLNSSYTLSSDADGEGYVQFSIPALKPGMHSAEFKVWDILNNSTTYVFEFEVAEGIKPNLIELFATPNPARQQVEFYLKHNRPESNLRVTVQVFDMTGKFLWSTEKVGSSEMFKAYIVSWNLCDNGGRRLRPGIYLYRAAIRTDHSKEATKANKLIILAQ